MIQREEYLKRLIAFKDKELIKVVTGIRRCGKSTLFDIYSNWLKENGIDDSQIIRLNLEDPKFNFLDEYMKLYNYVLEKLNPNKMNYVFIDEVQNIPDFQRACDGLYIKDNVDLYITGSNAYLLSGELATLLSGRYIEIKMLPLSFKEYISEVSQIDVIQKYNSYLTNSSFPYTINLSNKNEIYTYLDGIYNTIIMKDIAIRKNTIDVNILQNIVKFMFDNIGNACSATKIANTLTSMGKKISVPTVEIYLQALVDSFLLYKAERYDIKGKMLLATSPKYYVCDIGLRYYLLGSNGTDIGHILENIVYLELIRRGNRVYIGKDDENEIDFIVENMNGIEYYQVAYTTVEEKTLQRELKVLDNIKDHYPKYLLTMDFTPYSNYNGIMKINVLDWLLNKKDN